MLNHSPLAWMKPCKLDFYFDRPLLSEEIAASIAGGLNAIVYGQRRQGKTLLLQKVLQGQTAITMQATRDFTFGDFSRNLLLSLGCSVTTEQKRKRSGKGRAEVKFGWGLVSCGGVGEAGAETEQTERTFTAEVGSPNDVCYLLRQLKDVPVVIIDHFEELRQRNRKVFLEFLRVAAESKALQMVLVTTAIDQPLTYRELFKVGRHIVIIEVPPLREEENKDFVAKCFAHLGTPVPSGIEDEIYRNCTGYLETTIEACTIMAARCRELGVTSPRELNNCVLAHFSKRQKEYFLALADILIQQRWCCNVRKLATSVSIGDKSDTSTAFSDIDPVYAHLANAVSSRTSSVGEPLYPEAVDFAESLLEAKEELQARPSQSARLLAFALVQYLKDPFAQEVEQYIPAESVKYELLNVSEVMCEMLAESDLRDKVVFDADSFDQYLASNGYSLPTGGLNIAKLAKKVCRIQRKLRIDPPLLSVSSAGTEITLWDPMIHCCADIKEELQLLLDDGE